MLQTCCIHEVRASFKDKIHPPPTGGLLLQVEIDRKGRVLIPSQIRNKVRSRRFEVKVKDSSTIIMEGLPDSETVRGKYKGIFKGKNMSEIEETQERFMTKLRR